MWIASVTLHRGGSIWAQAVLRASNEPIETGKGSHVQNKRNRMQIKDLKTSVRWADLRRGSTAALQSNIMTTKRQP